MAGASLWATRLSGKLNGLIAPTTPIGTRSVKPSLPSPGDDGVERDHLAGELAGLGGGELERADRTLGLDPGRLDRLGRLHGDDAGELVPSARPAGAAARSRISARFHSGQRARRRCAALARRPPPGRRRPPRRPGTAPMTDPS